MMNIKEKQKEVKKIIELAKELIDLENELNSLDGYAKDLNKLRNRHAN